MRTYSLAGLRARSAEYRFGFGPCPGRAVAAIDGKGTVLGVACEPSDLSAGLAPTIEELLNSVHFAGSTFLFGTIDIDARTFTTPLAMK